MRRTFLPFCSSDGRKTAINSPADRFIHFTELPWIQRYCQHQTKPLLPSHRPGAEGRCPAPVPGPAQAAPRGPPATDSPRGHGASVVPAHERTKPFIPHSALLKPFLPIQHIALTGLIKRTSIFLKKQKKLVMNLKGEKNPLSRNMFSPRSQPEHSEKCNNMHY